MRIAVPKGFVAVLFHAPVADDLTTMFRNIRKSRASAYARVEAANEKNEKSSFKDTIAWAEYKNASEGLLAMGEATRNEEE